MKQCPQCSLTYNDDLSFCLNDGTALIAVAATQNTPPLFDPQSRQTARIEASAPTVFGGSPPSYPSSPQQPQFGQQPMFKQPNWGGTGAPPKKSYAGILIIVGILLVFGLVGVGGGLMIFMFAKPEPANVTSTETPISSYSQETGQGELKNGFKRVAFEDVTAQKVFPSANKTSSATYQDGWERVVSLLSVYNSPADAEAAFLKHLERIKSEGKTITTRQGNYAYYNKGNSYSTAFWLTNKLYEFNADDQQTLYRFAK